VIHKRVATSIKWTWHCSLLGIREKLWIFPQIKHGSISVTRSRRLMRQIISTAVKTVSVSITEVPLVFEIYTLSQLNSINQLTEILPRFLRRHYQSQLCRVLVNVKLQDETCWRDLVEFSQRWLWRYIAVPLKVSRRFGGICCLHHQCLRISQSRNHHERGSNLCLPQRTSRICIPEDRIILIY
jgi:hypothetical protein